MAAQDPYTNWLNPPGSNGFSNGKVITPSDTIDLDVIPLAFFIGGQGDFTITMPNGEKVTFKGINSGGSITLGLVWLRATRVWATGTTATNIVALW